MYPIIFSVCLEFTRLALPSIVMYF